MYRLPLILLLVTLINYSYAQNEEQELQILIEQQMNLKRSIKSQEDSLKVIESQIDYLNGKILLIKSQKLNLQVTAKKGGTIRSKSHPNSSIIYKFTKNEEVNLIDVSENNYLEITINNIHGFISDVWIIQDADFDNKIMALNIIKMEKEKIERDKIAAAHEKEKEETAARRDSLRVIQEARLERNAAIDDSLSIIHQKEKAIANANYEKKKKAENERIAEERRAAEELREKNLINKYGSVIAYQIIRKEVWIGMTATMAKESWGYPRDINRTTDAYGTREQWVYGTGTYLYFEDGILTVIQD